MKLLAHYLRARQQMHPEIVNWRENYLGDSLFYSYRTTVYNRSTFPSSLHYHDYYELVIFEQGDIRYICESQVYYPQPGDILLIPPGKLHMSMLNGETTLYKRHVFYLYPDAFDTLNCGALAGFLNKTREGLWVTTPSIPVQQELSSLLQQLDHALQFPEKPLEQALALGYVIRIFYLINQHSFLSQGISQHLPENVRKIQQYLDSHYAEIQSVSQVAKEFFYSREYLSRLFKEHFNTTVADYIRKRRVARSQSLIEQGIPLGEVCYQVGFENLSTFIRAFRSVTDMTPSQYRRLSAPKQQPQNSGSKIP